MVAWKSNFNCKRIITVYLIFMWTGFYGADDIEQAKSDMVIDCMEDMSKPLGEIFFAPDDKKVI